MPEQSIEGRASHYEAIGAEWRVKRDDLHRLLADRDRALITRAGDLAAYIAAAKVLPAHDASSCAECLMTFSGREQATIDAEG